MLSMLATACCTTSTHWVVGYTSTPSSVGTTRQLWGVGERNDTCIPQNTYYMETFGPKDWAVTWSGCDLIGRVTYDDCNAPELFLSHQGLLHFRFFSPLTYLFKTFLVAGGGGVQGQHLRNRQGVAMETLPIEGTSLSKRSSIEYTSSHTPSESI